MNRSQTVTIAAVAGGVLAATAVLFAVSVRRAEVSGLGAAGATAVVVPSASVSSDAPAADIDAGAGGDSADAGDDESPAASASSGLGPPVWKGCPPEMVRVGKVCIDRWEASLVDRRTKEPLSPYYPPQPKLCVSLERRWQTERATLGGPDAQAMPVPALPELQRGHFEPMAVSKPGVTPAGYLSGVVAEKACEAAGKRLCRVSEWVKACEGESRRQYPYGEKYEPGKCNIFRSRHPAAVLHDNPSIGHLDPRLNLVKEGNDPLLRVTGGTKSCASVWGPDALYDMNGNIDEWVIDDSEGPPPTSEGAGEEGDARRYKFVGGFFSRSKKDGCLSGVRNHGKTYFDYSTGVRCCRALGP